MTLPAVAHRLGIVGWPVAHSLSPAMHTAALHALGLVGWTYDLLPTAAADLPELWSRLRSEAGWRGVNVTVPHKESARQAVDACVDVADRIGAVNTIVVEASGRGTQLVGHNTDAAGFLAAIGDVSGRRCVVLGAGGSARAVVHGLAQGRAAEIRLVSRRQVVLPGTESLATPVRPAAWNDSALDGAEVVVSCTPPGVVPPSFANVADGAKAMDLVYYEKTPFLAAASARGLEVHDGLEMLIGQGAKSFALWTGKDPPVEVMRSAAVQAAKR